MIDKYCSDNAVDIYCGHAIEVLRSLPAESVQLVITSPPYWGLRNYSGGSDIVWGGDGCQHEWGIIPFGGRNKRPQDDDPKFAKGLSNPQGNADICIKCGAWRGQLGLEPTPELYVEHLMMIFREVKRVLRKDGSFYLNIGDTYAGSGSQGYQSQPQDYLRKYPQQEAMTPKCMVCIPERVMFAMIEDGWILRNKCIWHKPNAMPSSVKDRFTTTWEYLYFFTKARKYYFDLDAVRVPHATQSLERYQRGVNLDRPAIGKSAEVGPMQQYKRAPQWFQNQFPPDENYKGKFDDIFGHGPNPQSFNLRVHDVKRGKGGATVQSGELKASQKEIEEYEYPEKHHGSSMSNEASLHRDRQKHESVGLRSQSPSRKRHSGHFGEDGQPLVDFAKGKNPGDVFQSNREAYLINNPHTMRLRKDKYIALDPEHPNDLSHPKGKNPGDTVEATSVRHKSWMSTPGHPYTHKATGKPQNPGDYWELTTQPYKGAHFAVFPEKLVERPIKASSRVGDVVLDPFGGSGTTAVVAKRLGRKAILIDCVEDYCAISKERISKVEYQPGLGLSDG